MARELAALRLNFEQLVTDQKQLAPDQKRMVADQKQLAARQEQIAADQKQLADHQEQMATDLKHELAAGQEKVARDIADLQTAVQNIQNKISAPPPGPAEPARERGRPRRP